ncbi:hypothetical protein PR003_g1475 [Phytophthora rubi]|uniref:RxLR effector protein n=1 Tax=Phytophthora rubi TaxID=129364 RepID=A0A6A3P7R4_9STRA|nr:hypothetical protein PR002_g848 [Phytophthora rubi]KAE9051720.1 hypothetical protein PR001_g1176 [Phytophthora rubi]KAE9358055.1 hypothetical protein PR003_g1475 [Phytophthora rubi]
MNLGITFATVCIALVQPLSVNPSGFYPTKKDRSVVHTTIFVLAPGSLGQK